MGHLGLPELLVIFAIVFLIFGAKRLPEIVRNVGKSFGEFKKSLKEVNEETDKIKDIAKLN